MKNFSTAFVLIGCLAASLTGLPACGRSPLDEPHAPAGAGGNGGVGTTGLLPPSPGLFLCGTAVCTTSSQQCCLGVDSTGGLGASCAKIGSTCGGAAFQCDEPADCRGSAGGASSVCCFGLDSPVASASASGLGLGSRCESAAACVGPGRLVLCATDADCGPKGGVCCAAIGLPVCQPRCLPL